MTNAGLSSRSETASGSVLAELIEQITQDVESGAPVDVEAYAREHPEHAEQLRRLVPALLALHEVGPAAVESSRPEHEEPATRTEVHGVLGDFRILEEIGRGGMGVVYKAEQISLRRVIALKVLPFAAMLDSRQLQRFENEARAAACLHHTNIVPVHSVGCERGVHYYAMQYIEGHTLADLIRQLRRAAGLDPQVPSRGPDLKIRASEQPEAQNSELVDTGALAVPPPDKGNGLGPELKTSASEGPDFQIRPSLAPTPEHPDTGPFASLSTAHSRKGPAWHRAVAELGIQVAEALDYAHSVGVVHRDIKPANLLLDSRGQVWITDFGLAQIEVDAGMTMSGEVLGTLRYMSPEQALGQRGVLDHRTDIYSLGITLYELLVLQPAFSEENRGKLVRQVIEDEPRPLRSLDAGVPRDLETILQKAAAKDPADRYVTARALADDLRRALDNRPIVARRAAWHEHASRWMQRHAAVTLLTLAFLVLAVIGLSLSTIWIANERAVAKQAEVREREQAVIAARRENDARIAERDASRQAAIANDRRQQARAALKGGKSLADLMSSKLLKELDSPFLQPVRQELSDKAADFYKQFAVELHDDPAAAVDRFECLLELHKLRRAADDRSAEFEEEHKTLVVQAEEFVRRNPSPEAKSILRRCVTSLAIFYLESERGDARPHFRRGLALAREVLAADPQNKKYREAVAGACANLVITLPGSLGADRLALTKEAIALREKLLEDDPQNPDAVQNLASLYLNTYGTNATVEMEPERYAAEATPTSRKLFESFRDEIQTLLRLKELLESSVRLRPACRDDLTRTYTNLGEAHASVGDPQEANRFFALAVESHELYKVQFPGSSERLATTLYGKYAAFLYREEQYADALRLYHSTLANIPYPHQALEFAQRLLTCPDETFRSVEKASRIRKMLLKRFPERPFGLTVQGLSQYREGQYADAVDSLEKSLVISELDNKLARPFLAMAYHKAGMTEKGRQAYDALVRDNIGTKAERTHELPVLHARREADALFSAMPDDSDGMP